MTSLEVVKQVVKTLDDKKAENIDVLRIGDLTIMADYFVIASTTNSTHVKSLVDEVEYQLKEQGVAPLRIEGYQYANWVILDYGDVVVHIFHEETRNYYNLDRLWSDGEQVDIQSLLKD
ncbi:MAG: ribosome silencing factor [Massiliimalia sp.]